jgi:hypothetical protein
MAGEGRVVADGAGVGAPLHERSSGDTCHRRGSGRLPANPYPPEAFRWGEVLRLRVGLYRVMYTVEGDLITVVRVDRVAG